MFDRINDPIFWLFYPLTPDNRKSLWRRGTSYSILAPSLKLLPFSDLNPRRRHLAPHRCWPFLVTPPAPGVLIWARPSHRVAPMHREAAFASCRTGDIASTHARTQDRGVWSDVCYLLLSNDTPHDSCHLAWLRSANNSSPLQFFHRQNNLEALASGFCSVGGTLQNLAVI